MAARREPARAPDWRSDPPSPFVRTSARARQRAATRERLYTAALREFRRVGFERASISGIARAARVSRPNFYAHFPTRDHVLFEMAWRLAREIARGFETATDLPATLERLGDGLIEAEAAVNDPALFREMISIFARRPLAPPIDVEQIPVLRELRRRFEAARAAGELREGMDPEQAARLCLSAVFGNLLGVDATPAERRADLRALFSLFLADRGRRAR